MASPAHDQSPRANPMQTDGFEFVEFGAPDPTQLHRVFSKLGFDAVAHHRSKHVVLYQQGDIHFIVNQEAYGHAPRFAKQHGPSACAMAFRVKNAELAYRRALTLGAQAYTGGNVSPLEARIPGLYGIGDSLLYLVDQRSEHTIYEVDFVTNPPAPASNDVGLREIDHLTHNVHFGHMKTWVDYYQGLFNFEEIHYFDIKGTKTSLQSRALTSPCGKIRIPINESADDKSQIVEYLDQYHGEGIQHIALSTRDIYQTIAALKANGIRFLDVPDAYYEQVEKRLPGHGENLEKLRDHRILIDGGIENGKPHILLQVFTENMIGPIFFEIIQRKGDQGFGEGNFQALFEAMERDQIARGVL
jgi:4-hydroxyphenylpyruvate dioxygenase